MKNKIKRNRRTYIRVCPDCYFETKENIINCPKCRSPKLINIMERKDVTTWQQIREIKNRIRDGFCEIEEF